MDESSARGLIACAACARLKIRCDRKVPCSACAAKQVQCQPRWSRRSSEGADQSRATKQNSQQRGAANRRLVDKGKGNGNSGNSGNGSAEKRHVCTSPANFAGAASRPATLSASLLAEDTALFNDANAQLDPFFTDVMQIDSSIPVPQAITDFGFQFDPLSFDEHIQTNDFGYSTTPMLPSSNYDASVAAFPTFSSALTGRVDGSVESASNSSSTTLSSLGQTVPSSVSSTPPPGQSQSGSRSGPRSLESPRVPDKIDSAQINHHSIYDQEIALAVQDSWSHFRCNPPLVGAPTVKTAGIHLHGLAHTLVDQDQWENWSMQADDLDPWFKSHIVTEPCLGSTRDKLLTITQTILQRAFEAHKTKIGPGLYEGFKANGQTFGVGDDRFNPYVILPPPHIIEYFLRCYISRIEPYYPSICGGKLQTNDLMKFQNPFTPTLLLLLMMALGNMGSPSPGARHLTSGLTEACRVSLHNAIEIDVQLKSNPIILRSALLLVILAAWGGDKWHMDMAIDQRGMYLSMLSHSGMMDASEFRLSVSECRANPEAAWRAWKEHESRTRVVHSWVMVDLELSLFNDVASLLPINDLNVAMPESEILWQVTTASDWLRAFEHTYPGATYEPMPSFCELFRRLTQEDVTGEQMQLSSLQLGLLLHPLQTLVHHVRQFLSCFEHGGSYRKPLRTRTGNRMRSKLEEVHVLLRRWYALGRRKSKQGAQLCPQTCVNLILYHLISLNTFTCFISIEKLARRETSSEKSPWLLFHCVDEGEEVFFHCGQVLRLLRLLPEPVRPPWWAAAVYRVALTAWANSLAHARGRYPMTDRGTGNGPRQELFLIDQVLPDHPSVERYCRYQEGEPMLLGRHGGALSLRTPENALRYCIDLLNENTAMAFTTGIRDRLVRLHEQWRAVEA